MSDTPETDSCPAERIEGLCGQLERERDEARDTVFRLRKQRAIARNFGEQMERERDNARRMAEGLRSAACEKRGSFKLPWEINE
jgi:hypothetical protein